MGERITLNGNIGLKRDNKGEETLIWGAINIINFYDTNTANAISSLPILLQTIGFKWK